MPRQSVLRNFSLFTGFHVEVNTEKTKVICGKADSLNNWINENVQFVFQCSKAMKIDSRHAEGRGKVLWPKVHQLFWA